MSEDNNKAGRESKEEAQKPVTEKAEDESSIPLFLRNRSDGKKGDAQDEKDETGE